MKIEEIPALLEAVCIQKNFTNEDIKTVYCSDLLSDVLGNAPEYAVLVTVQAHQNSIAVASMKDFPAIIVCNNRQCPDDMIHAAEEHKIGIFSTALDQFTVSGRLYSAMSLTKSIDH